VRHNEANQATATDEPFCTRRLSALLERAASFAADSGFEHAADGLGELLDRFREQRFHLAVLGQFKRGKSTLLNALLGEDVLPASVIPVTAVPTFIRAGDDRRARISFSDGSASIEHVAADARELNEFIAQYVTEPANPRNRLHVSQVEVFHPAPILREGVVLIDTPGIGSTHRHNTEATLNFIPQCDAALFVTSPDPPVTEVEIEFLGRVLAGTSRLFLVLNKVDYLRDAERGKLLEYLGEVLRRQAGMEGDVSVLCVSARAGLEARQNGDAEQWARSGMAAVEALLVDFLAGEKERALAQAIARNASAIVADVLLQQRLAVQSLKMPLDELEARLQALKSKLAEIRGQNTALKDMLEGDRKRLEALLEEQAEQLRRRARKHFTQVALDALEQNRFDTDLAQNVLGEVIPTFFEHELGEMSRVFGDQVKKAISRHRRRADEIVESVRRTAAQLFDVACRSLPVAEEFEVKREPYWVTHQWPVSLGVLPESFWDKLLPLGLRRARALARIRDRIETLVAENVENVRWPTLLNLQKAFRDLGADLDARLEEAVAATTGAIEAAYRRRAEQSELVAAEMELQESRVCELERLGSELQAVVDGCLNTRE